MVVQCTTVTAGWCSECDGPTAGTETVDPLEFLARVLVHIPDTGHVTTRYYGWYANRLRGRRGKAEAAAADGPPAMVAAPQLGPTEAARRWAALLQQHFEVDPLACPSCRGVMRIVAFITQPSVIDQLLTHLRAATAAPGAARSSPSTRGASGPGATRRPAAAHRARCASPRRPDHARGRAARASVPPGRPTGRSAGRRVPAGPRGVGARAVRSPVTRTTPFEFPIPRRGALTARTWTGGSARSAWRGSGRRRRNPGMSHEH